MSGWMGSLVVISQELVEQCVGYLVGHLVGRGVFAFTKVLMSHCWNTP